MCPRLGECCVGDGFEERIDEVNGAGTILLKATGDGEDCEDGEQVNEHAANAAGVLWMLFPEISFTSRIAGLRSCCFMDLPQIS